MQVWTARDGLPANATYSVAQTADGFLWIGTEDGLAQFDGLRFQSVDFTGPLGSASEFITALAANGTGQLLVGTGSSGVLTVSATRNAVRVPGAWPAHPVNEVTFDGDRVLAAVRGVGLIDAGSDADGNRNSGPMAAVAGVTALAPRREGGVWVATRAGGVGWYDGVRIRTEARLSGLDSLDGGDVQDLLEDRSGGLWVATRNGLLRASGEGVSRYGPEQGLPATSVNSLLEDTDGRVWIGTSGNGVGRLCGDRFEMLGSDNGLPPGVVEDLLQARDGSIWVASNGLVRLSQGDALPLTARHGLPSEPILPVLQSRDGAMWMGTFGGGLVRLHEGSVRVLTELDGLSSDFVLSLAEDPDGSLWVGTRSGLDRVDRGHVTRHGTAEGFTKGPTVPSLLHDGETLWIGSVEGLLSQRDGVIVKHADQREFGARLVSMFKDSAGVLWIATDGGGLFRWMAGRLEAAVFQEQLPSRVVLALHESPAGVLWAATSRGIARWDGHALGVVSTRHGLREESAGSLLEDADGYLWWSGNRGVSRAPIAELTAVATGKRERLDVQHFSASDGMPRSETNSGFQPAAWRDGRGRHWYPTSDGVAVFDPAAEMWQAESVQVKIMSVAVDGREVDHGGTIDLAANPGALELSYVAPAFASPNGAEYQYRLLGFDDAWYPAQESRKVTYWQLPPGDFVFEVRARSGMGTWSEPASAPISIAPHLFESKAFWAFCLFGVAGTGGGFVRHRSNARRKWAQRDSEAQKMQSLGLVSGSIAQDFSGMLLEIVRDSASLAEALPTNHPLQAGASNILKKAEAGAALTAQLLEFARPQQENVSWLDLSAELVRLEPLLRRLVPPSIAMSLRCDGAAECRIDADQFQQLVLNIVLNARDAMPQGGEIQIALRPARRSECEHLQLAAGSEYAQLVIRDTGTGIAPSDHHRIFEPFFTTKPRGRGTGLGLAVAHGTIRSAGGFVEVHSALGCGAAFHVYLPVRGEAAVPKQRADELGVGHVPAQAVPTAVADAAEPVTDVQAHGVCAPVPVGMRLLVLDDDAQVGRTVRLMAQRAGFEVEISHSTRQFFDRVESWNPSHVLVDLVLPTMDGVQVLRALAEGGYQGRALIMSGMGARVLAAARRAGEGYGLRMGGVLAKPFRTADVHAALSESEAKPARGFKSAALNQAFAKEEFSQALDRRQLLLHYQPKISLASGALTGFEALVRWQHPIHGLVFPDAFIPLAESCGLIEQMTKQVIDGSLTWLAKVAPGGPTGMSINLSARNLNDDAVADYVFQRCEQLQIDCSRVTLELTETSAMLDPVDALQRLTGLRLKGFELAIDDFGTGFSSMLQLARLPFSQIKVDRSFVMSMESSEESRKIVASTIGLGSSLGLTTVAEGVEDAAILDALRLLGCDRAQGYHIARPMDGDAAQRWMNAHRPVFEPRRTIAATPAVAAGVDLA